MESPELVPTPKRSEYFVPGRVSTIANYWFQNLSGKIMTVIDASLPGGPQCKAAKDLACQAIWQVYNEMWDELSREGPIED